MATAGKVKVGNKDVFIKDVTYDDIVILYQQYIDTYGNIPTTKECDLKHNMPYSKIISSILQEKNISKIEFISQFNKGLSLQDNVKKQIEVNKSRFPVQICGLMYNTFGNVDVTYKKGGHYLYWFNLIDDNGYKYYTNYNIISRAVKDATPLSRFFKGNKYTYDNINLFCKENNIDLQIDGSNLSVVGLARTPLPFVDSDNKRINVTWNYIQKRANKQSDSDCIKFKNTVNIDKETVIRLIKEKEKELGRPLLQSDFEHTETTQHSVGIRAIFNIWGNFTNMVNDLGLKTHNTYFRPNDKHYQPHDEIMQHIKNVCNKVKSENRNVVLLNDFVTENISKEKIKSHCKLENTSLRNYIKQYECTLQAPGMGFNYIFDDGEKVVSNYEYEFSKYIRSIGFTYQRDYFRDVLYSDIDSKYNGKINCDYKIIIDGKYYYFELAGILGNMEHQNCYLSNTKIINSNSKEQYRLKLNEKRNIFERNNLNYFILLPKDMNIENYEKIFNELNVVAA